MILELNEFILEKINSNNLKSRDFIEYVLENSDYKLHFKIKDIKGQLSKENVYSQLSLDKLYNDNEENIKRAYIKDNKLYLDF